MDSQCLPLYVPCQDFIKEEETIPMCKRISTADFGCITSEVVFVFMGVNYVKTMDMLDSDGTVCNAVRLSNGAFTFFRDTDVVCVS